MKVIIIRSEHLEVEESIGAATIQVLHYHWIVKTYTQLTELNDLQNQKSGQKRLRQKWFKSALRGVSRRPHRGVLVYVNHGSLQAIEVVDEANAHQVQVDGHTDQHEATN